MPSKKKKKSPPPSSPPPPPSDESDATSDDPSEPAASLLPECKVNQLCRIQRALFGKEDEVVPMPQLLHELHSEDLKRLAKAQLNKMQHNIAAAACNNGDPRWIQFYIMVLMRGMDIMETAVLDENEESMEILKRTALAVAQAKSAMGASLHRGNGIHVPYWVLGVAVGVVVLLFLVILVMFSVALREIAIKK